MQVSNLKIGRLAVVLGFLSSLAVGCVIGVGQNGKASKECPEPNSFLKEGECFCDPGYDWCEPNDAADLRCCVDDDSSSQTNNTPAQTDTTNSTPATEGTSGGTSGDTTVEPPTTSDSGTTGEPLECVVEASPPGDCDENIVNFLCLEASDAECGPQGSQFYICMAGTWVEDPTGPDANCKNDGFDFGYGCVDEDEMVQFVCGVGPGTDCEASGPTCNGETDLEECYYGKLSVTNCEAFCMEVGDGVMTYDYGYCGEQEGATSCICCDEGDEGCPINEGTTGDTGGTTAGDTGGTGTSG